jgi:hypothetical protein
VDGAVEYLIRYEDPHNLRDVWVKGAELMCPSKIMDFFEGRVPSELEPRLPLSEEASAPLPPPDPDNEIAIVGVEKNQDGHVFVCFQLGNDRTLRKIPQEEMNKSYQEQFVKFLEKYLSKPS